VISETPNTTNTRKTTRFRITLTKDNPLSRPPP
jgi:hypothetical protein